MDTKNVILFVFDEKENFEKSKDSIATEGVTIKKMICIDNLNSFEDHLKNLNDDDYISLAVHVFGQSEDLRGIKKFLTSQIGIRYPKLKPMYITETLVKKDQVDHLIIDLDLPKIGDIYRYHHVFSNINNDKYVYTKREIMNISETKDTRFEYAIIVALFEKEFEQLKTVFDFPEAEIM